MKKTATISLIRQASATRSLTKVSAAGHATPATHAFPRGCRSRQQSANCNVNCFILELLGDLLRTRPQEFDGLENIIVVDNIPQVGADRFDKLKTVLTKLFAKAGEIASEHYPKDNKDVTLG